MFPSKYKFNWNIFFQNISHGEEDDNPGAGVVVLAVRVQQADGVQEWRVEGPHVREVGRLKSLAKHLGFKNIKC